jgi:hypothetical protein
MPYGRKTSQIPFNPQYDHWVRRGPVIEIIGFFAVGFRKLHGFVTQQ